MSERERLSAVALSHLTPPRFAGGSWTLNPDALADAIIAAGFGDKAEAWDEGLSAGCDRWQDSREFGDAPVNPYTPNLEEK